MYCYHCGKKIDEHALEAKQSTLENVSEELPEGTTVSYVCPRCGHLIHAGHDEKDIKALAAASHAEIQRGKNSFASGMGFAVVGVIALILSAIFYRLSYKPGQQNRFVPNCPEFYVCCILLSLGAAAVIYGAVRVVMGVIKQQRYRKLLKDVQNETFVQ